MEPDSTDRSPLIEAICSSVSPGLFLPMVLPISTLLRPAMTMRLSSLSVRKLAVLVVRRLTSPSCTRLPALMTMSRWAVRSPFSVSVPLPLMKMSALAPRAMKSPSMVTLPAGLISIEPLSVSIRLVAVKLTASAPVALVPANMLMPL